MKPTANVLTQHQHTVCKVEMLTIDQDTGEVRKGVQQFGEVKSNFRAIYDDNPSLDASRTAAMVQAARTPAELGYKM